MQLGKLAAIFVALALPALAQEVAVTEGAVVTARLIQPTGRYDHAVLGDALEWGGLELGINTCLGCAKDRLQTLTITLPVTRVFEDVTARVADLDGDGRAEVIVVETDLARGGSLAIYDARGKRAATAFPGQTHRWVAPAGVGDFNGDGRIEIAYVDRPHLAREVVFLRYHSGNLTEIARAAGFTNHRIGDALISGGTRRCGGRDTLVLANGEWSRVMELWLDAGRVRTSDLGVLRDNHALSRAMRCR